MKKIIDWLLITLGAGMVVIIPVGVIGWISNIVQVIGIDNVTSSTEGLVKLIGIPVAPLGAVLGIMGWF